MAEILNSYQLLDPPSLSPQESTRVCNVLTLMQCVASDDNTRDAFIEGTNELSIFMTLFSFVAQFPLYVYPYLNTTSKAKPFEFLRLTSLGVIGALVKNEKAEVITYLLGTEIVPLCLRIMEIGNELSKTVAIFIIQKIILDNFGLSYICQTDQRLNAVLDHFEVVLKTPAEPGKTSRMLKHAIRCYLRLTDDEKGLKILRKRCPKEITDNALIERIHDDATTIKFIQEIKSRL